MGLFGAKAAVTKGKPPSGLLITPPITTSWPAGEEEVEANTPPRPAAASSPGRTSTRSHGGGAVRLALAGRRRHDRSICRVFSGRLAGRRQRGSSPSPSRPNAHGDGDGGPYVSQLVWRRCLSLAWLCSDFVPSTAGLEPNLV